MLGAGDVLHCADGARLARGAPVVSRDAFFAELFLADVPPGVRATVRYVGLEPGLTSDGRRPRGACTHVTPSPLL
jgi:hypothetical protein